MSGFYSDDDEDFFADSKPNPFRSGDLLDTAPASGIMPHQPLNIPDPNSGMTGSFELPEPQTMQQQPRAPPPALSGTMDINHHPFALTTTQNSSTSYGGTDDVESTPPGRFAWCLSCLRMDRYKEFFDMDTADIALRVKSALVHFYKPDHFRIVVVGESRADNLKGSDLYGPLWISMTLVLLLGVTGNMSAYLDHRGNDKMDTFEYDLNHLMRAGSIVFAFAVLLPLALTVGTTCMGMPAVSWDMWLCCYGYAQTPFLLAALVAWLPVELVEWIAVGAATGVSLLLLVRNLSTPLMSQDSAHAAKAAPVILFMVGAHFVYFMTLKLAFYK